MKRKKLIFEARNGLGNCLRALYSCVYLAAHLDRELLVLWDNFSQFWTNTEFEVINRHDTVMSIVDENYFGLDFSTANLPETINKIVNDDSPVIHVSTGQMFKPPSASLHDYQSGKITFYQSLHLQPKIKHTIDTYRSKYFIGNKVLGVQIRNKYRKQYPVDLDLALNYTSQIISDYSILFLTTDDPSVYDAARDRLPIEIIYADHDRESFTDDELWTKGNITAQALHDLSDFYLLGECNFILHSYCSTFGYEAAFLRGIPFFSIPGTPHVEFPYYPDSVN